MKGWKTLFRLDHKPCRHQRGAIRLRILREEILGIVENVDIL